MTEPTYRKGSGVKPKIFPKDSSISGADLNRVQSISFSWSRPNEPGYELGNSNELGERLYKLPEVTSNMVINEHGVIDAWALFTNQDPTVATECKLSDMADTWVDIVSMSKTLGGTMLTSTRMARAYVNSFTLSIPGAQEKVEQTWGFEADNKKDFINDNDNFIDVEHTITSAEETAGSFTLSVAPVINADDGVYMLRSAYIHSGTEAALVEGTSFTVSGSTISEGTVSMVENDVWVLHYTASSGASFAAVNTVDASFIKGDQVEILIKDGGSEELNTTRLESVNISGSIAREVHTAIGNKDAFARSSETPVVTIELGNVSSDLRLYEILRGKTIGSYGIIDITKFLETLELEVKIYTDNTKTVFLSKYLIRNFKVASGNDDSTANAILKDSVSLEASNLLFTTVEATS